MKDYEEELYTDEELEEYEQEKQRKEKQNKAKKSSHKTKKIVKKSKNKKPKQKVVYKYRDNKKSHSGIWIFLLLLVIIVLIGVIGYLLYIQKNENETNLNPTIPSQKEDKVCEAKASTLNIASGLNKCADSTNFKLILAGNGLSFDITRTNDNNFPYLISTIYYNDQKVNLSGSVINGLKVTNDWQIKANGGIIYLKITQSKENGSDILVAFEDGKIIYSNKGNIDYNLSSALTYTKYTDLGLKKIETCENYEADNNLEKEMWTKGTLEYENGKITEIKKETIIAKDVCEKQKN